MATKPVRKEKPESFRHTPRELSILNGAHGAMMQHLRDGHRYDVVKRAWVDAAGNVVAQ